MSETNNTNNAPATVPPAAPNGNGTSTRKKLLFILGTVFIIVGISFGLYWLLFGRFYESTDDAYVQGNVVQVTPQVAGTVTKIYADDTDIVDAGAPLLGLDSADADVALAQAEAQLAQTVREVRTLYASQAQSGANLNLRKADLARAQDDLTRRKALAGTGAVSTEEIRHAELAVTSAQAEVAAAQQQLVSGSALTDGTTVRQHPNVLRAAAQVQAAMLMQARTRLYAPVGGQIAKRNAQVGQHINAGAPVMAIIPLDQLWIDANYKEAQLRRMRIGQPVTLEADLYGGKVKYDGKVIGLGAGTGSAFALLPAQNATGNWIKVVQRVPVRIGLDPKQLAQHPLRIGLSMSVDVDLHDQSGAPVGTQNGGNHALSAAPAAMDPIETQAKARIASIIDANLK